MAVTPNGPILYSDLAALATLATTKLSPSTPYAFTPFLGADQLASPNSITATPTYSIGSWADGQKVSFWLFPYKTIAGVKNYVWNPVVKVFVGQSSSGNFSMTWTWVSPVGPTAPSGYLVVIPYVLGTGFQYIWRDIGNLTTLTEDGSFSNPAWQFDVTLDANNNGNPSQNLPCGHGTWLKTLNQIHNDLFTNLTLFGGSKYTYSDSFLLSGPWCVSVAQKCYLNINGTHVYKNLQFWYSEADSITGNQLSPEADMFGIYIGVNNGVNNFNWDRNVIVNGTIIISSQPSGQAPTDWALSASHPGITITFNPNYTDGDRVPPLGPVTAFIFTFTNVQYILGTAIVLTCTPLSGGSVVGNGNPTGGGGRVDCTFTGDKTVYTASDQIAIHGAGPAAKSAALTSTLTNIVLTTPTLGTNSNESHFRSFCNGVFVANTLATIGVFPFVDVDLPQYQPSSIPATASTRRIALDVSLPYIASVDNRGALWPIFRDTDFAPTLAAGLATAGSKAWNVLGTKYANPFPSSDSAAPMSFGDNNAQFITSTIQEIRFYTSNPNAVIYAKSGGFPTLTDFDVMAVGGNWGIAFPGAIATWFWAIYNPTTNNLTSQTTAVIFTSLALPQGTFFPTTTDGLGVTVPNTEGASYHIADPSSFDLRPIPLFGYSIYSLTIRRSAVNNGSGIAIAPDAGTSDLNVTVGIMEGFGFDSAGTFTPIQTIVVPAGQATITVPVFLPVLGGTFLSYQCSEQVFIRCAVNFQPIIQSSFSPSSVTFNGNPYVVGSYNGIPFYDKKKTLLTFVESDLQQPVVFPISSQAVNDLTSTLNLL